MVATQDSRCSDPNRIQDECGHAEKEGIRKANSLALKSIQRHRDRLPTFRAGGRFVQSAQIVSATHTLQIILNGHCKNLTFQAY